MKIIKTLPSFSALFFSALLCGQVSFRENKGSFTVSTRNMQAKQIQVIDGVSTIHYSNSKPFIDGSPYLTEKFVEGSMTVVDGTVIPGMWFRYNIYRDEMQLLLNGDTASITKPLSLHSLELGEKKFVYDVYQVSKNVVAAGYFEVIEEGKNLSILLKREIELKQDIYVPHYAGGGGTKEFRMAEKSNYFLKQDGNAAQKVKSRKDFLNTITHFREDVKQYIRENRISVRKEEELKALVNYYNSLVTPAS